MYMYSQGLIEVATVHVYMCMQHTVGHAHVHAAYSR